jgi:hypothetical protein
MFNPQPLRYFWRLRVTELHFADELLIITDEVNKLAMVWNPR